MTPKEYDAAVAIAKAMGALGIVSLSNGGDYVYIRTPDEEAEMRRLLNSPSPHPPL